MSDTKRSLAELTALTWPDGRPKIAPVQGYAAGIPWSLHLKAYEAYSKKWSPQEAMIDLEGRGCRGGFSVDELDDFIPGWRDEVEELGRLWAEVARLTAALAQPARAQAGVAELVAEIRAAAEQFHFYKNQHRQKGTPDGDEKSIANEHWALRMERVAYALAALGGEDV